MSTKYLLLLGLPGSGKGTVATNLTNRFSFAHVSCGDVFRAQVKQGTDFGKLAATYIQQGQLTPDAETSKMFLTYLETCRANTLYIIEGFPRTLGQAQDLELHLRRTSREMLAVVQLCADMEVLVERLRWRRICSKCGRTYNLRTLPPLREGKCDFDDEALIQREDDREEVIRSRLSLYQKEEQQILEFYRKKSILKLLQAVRDPTSLVEDVINLIPLGTY